MVRFPKYYGVHCPKSRVFVTKIMEMSDPPIGALWGKGLLEKSIYKCNLLTHEDVLCPASWPSTVRWTRQFVGSSGRDQDCTWVRRCCLGVFQTCFRLTKGTSNVDPLGYVPFNRLFERCVFFGGEDSYHNRMDKRWRGHNVIPSSWHCQLYRATPGKHMKT